MTDPLLATRCDIPDHPPCVSRLRQAGIPCPQATIGSTPSCSHPVPEMSQLTEVHPGNYLFYGEQLRVSYASPEGGTGPG